MKTRKKPVSPLDSTSVLRKRGEFGAPPRASLPRKVDPEPGERVRNPATGRLKTVKRAHRGRPAKAIEVTMIETLRVQVAPWLRLATRGGRVGYLMSDMRSLLRAARKAHLTTPIEQLLLAGKVLQVDRTTGIGYVDVPRLNVLVKSLPGASSGQDRAIKAIASLLGVKGTIGAVALKGLRRDVRGWITGPSESTKGSQTTEVNGDRGEDQSGTADEGGAGGETAGDVGVQPAVEGGASGGEGGNDAA